MEFVPGRQDERISSAALSEVPSVEIYCLIQAVRPGKEFCLLIEGVRPPKDAG